MKRISAIVVQWVDYLRNIMILYRKVWSVSRLYIIGSLFAVLVSAYQPFNHIIFIKLILDAVIEKKDFRAALFYVFAMCLIAFAVRWFNALYLRAENNIIEKTKAKLLLDIEQKTMEISYESLENREVQDNRQKAMEIFYPMQSGYMDLHKTIILSKQMVIHLFQIIGLVSILSTLNPLLVLGMVLVSALSIVIEAIASEREFKVWDISLVHFARKIGYLQEIGTNVGYAKEMRLYKADGWVVNKLRHVSGKMLKEVSKTVLGFTITAIVSNLLLIIMNGILYLVFYMMAMQNLITIADVTVYLNSVSAFIAALIGISTCVVMIFKSGMYINAYNRYMALSDVNGEGQPGQPDAASIQAVEIEFHNVHFRYPTAEEETLSGVSFLIRDHTKTAIVGDNGAGKTTIIKLLLKLYQPTSGMITINGIDINKISNKTYYDLLSVVFQDFKVTNFSLRENIAFSDADDRELDRIISQINMGAMVDDLPHGYDTICGKLFDQDGIELSGGQAQKVAIARALHKKSKLVILDEPTAMLSPVAEYEIYTNFNELTEGKTTIYISHRMSSCRFCDNILVLENGRVIEEGNHHALMKQNGQYHTMFMIQAEFYQTMS